MLRSTTSSWCLYATSSAPCMSFLEPYCDLGAPGQSTLNSGLAMSVTCRLYLARIFCASAISASEEAWRFLPHISRSSTHCRPKSFAITEHAWSKSCEISSEITEILKGDCDADALPKSGRVAQAAAAIPAPAIKLRLETPSMFLLFPNIRPGVTHWC